MLPESTMGSTANPSLKADALERPKRKSFKHIMVEKKGKLVTIFEISRAAKDSSKRRKKGPAPSA